MRAARGGAPCGSFWLARAVGGRARGRGSVEAGGGVLGPGGRALGCGLGGGAGWGVGGGGAARGSRGRPGPLVSVVICPIRGRSWGGADGTSPSTRLSI